MLKKILFLIAVIGLSAGNAFAGVVSGEIAPDFTLNDTAGNQHSLSDYQGQYVVLEWINHDCPFVKKHYGGGNMQSLQSHYGDLGVVWLSVASSAPGKQGNYTPEEWDRLTLEKGASPAAVLLDADGKVGRLYGAQTTPHIFIVGLEGELVYQGAIDDNPSADSQDIEGAKNYVRETLDAVLSGGAVIVDSTKSYGCSVKYE